MTILGFAGRWPDAVDARLQSAHAHAQAANDSTTGQKADTPFASLRAPQLFQSQGVVVAVRGEPFGRAEPASGAPGAAAKIHAAYLKEGRNFLGRLHGTFALAIVDETAKRVLLAIDRMGVERMTWSVVGGAIAFGSSAEQVARFPGVNASLRAQSLYDFLMLHMTPAPHTIYERVYKLRPATAVAFENGRAEVFAHWTPTFEERRETPFEALRTQLHDALDAAVREQRPDERTGAFLSGGLDSSTVAGKLGKASPRPARTFSIGFGVDAYDELKYADIAVRHFGFDAVQYHVTPEDIIHAFPLIAGAYDEPFGNSSAVPTYFCALRAREHGITRLLAGDGGDEIFGGNERYARQQIFDLYYKAPGAVRRGVLEPLARILPGEGGFKPLAKLRSYIEQARIPLPERLESWNFIYREGGAMLEPEFAASIDPRAPFDVMREVYEAAPCRSTLNKLMYYDWYYTLADSDLRKVNTMCALAGVEVTYPMLDTRVVELANRITPAQKMRRLELRSFYKDAMRGFLPDAILEKKKHGFGLPFGVWLQSHAQLSDMIYSHLTDLKARRIVRAEFLDRIVAAQRTADASYYGYAIWDLAMLEAWLKAHTPRV